MSEDRPRMPGHRPIPEGFGDALGMDHEFIPFTPIYIGRSTPEEMAARKLGYGSLADPVRIPPRLAAIRAQGPVTDAEFDQILEEMAPDHPYARELLASQRKKDDPVSETPDDGSEPVDPEA